jgi:hypothetical protein
MREAIIVGTPHTPCTSSRLSGRSGLAEMCQLSPYGSAHQTEDHSGLSFCIPFEETERNDLAELLSNVGDGRDQAAA